MFYNVLPESNLILSFEFLLKDCAGVRFLELLFGPENGLCVRGTCSEAVEKNVC